MSRALLAAVALSLSACPAPPTFRRAPSPLHDAGAPLAPSGSPECGPPRAGAVCLASGLSRLGTDDGEAQFEQRPPRAARLRAFYVALDEVTGAQWRRCVSAGRCAAMRCDAEVGDDAPARCVSWTDARAYCAFVNGRLPTEAEWEHAAAGLLPGHRRFPWGDDADGADVTPEGVRAMGGAVAEWTDDAADFYPNPPRREPLDAGAPDEDDLTDASVEAGVADGAPEFTDGGLWVVDDPRGRAGSPWRALRGGDRTIPRARWTSSARRFRLPDDAPTWAGVRCVW